MKHMERRSLISLIAPISGAHFLWAAAGKPRLALLPWTQLFQTLPPVAVHGTALQRLCIPEGEQE